jgi:hypothetical protein
MAHTRSASISNPQMASLSQNSKSPIDDQRRMSLESAPPTTTEPTKLSQTPPVSVSVTPKTQPAAPPHIGRGHIAQQPLVQGYMGFPQYTLGNLTDSNGDVLFSAALPPESQQLLGSTLDPRDPMTAMLMAGSSCLPQPSFNSNSANNNSNNAVLASTGAKLGVSLGAAMFPSFDGMNNTLAPGENYEFNALPQPNYFEEGMKEIMGDSLSGTLGGLNADFNLFIDPDQWGEVPNGSQ